MKKVELLAPAGNFAALKGAINAGADAVYLGGQKYGARAYADNFSKEEICEGIHLAHVFGKKIYLTVNTLVKEKELDELYSFLLPYYECGLDGVIVQDLGALCFMKRHFPYLSLHASTQMTLTGCSGTELLQEAGVSRIVPARELSLEEIKKIKHDTGVEVEAFIHGAMCYCYSGQCLFSSILGGRSGNRGRCAQPCRLPYRMDNGKEQYPLSMRDMCTIRLIPQLIEAGIDSFKIEGRMKKPAYAAGVTAIYRKYIDLYYEDQSSYHVDEKDIERLHALYVRSEIGDGYYNRHNGREMITLDSPAYSETDEELLQELERNYIKKTPSVNVTAEIILLAGKTAELGLQADGLKITCSGKPVTPALNQPLSKENVIRQIRKSGNSQLNIENVKVTMQDEVFMPLSALNELRRQAVSAMERELIRQNGLLHEERETARREIEEEANRDWNIQEEGLFEAEAAKRTASNICQGAGLHVMVRTLEQLKAAVDRKAERIYIDYGLLLSEGMRKLALLMEEGKTTAGNGIQFYAATPYIVREKELHYLAKITGAIEDGQLFGVLIRNLESYGYFRKYLKPERLVLDTGMYLWNRESVRFFDQKVAECYLPVECNRKEMKELLNACKGMNVSHSILVYGRLPMMITANCLKKTTGACHGESGMTMLTDRYGKRFPVLNDCLSCYNVVYNSVPLSLHSLFREKGRKDCRCRLDFTIESGKEAQEVIRYFQRIADCYEEPPYQEYTTGHYKRGVE